MPQGSITYQVLKRPSWPAQSLDLNIIENVWTFVMSQRIVDRNRWRDETTYSQKK